MTHILVIEDEESFRDALQFMLSREGFDVTLAPNGAEGMKLFDSTNPDLILLDLMLPEVSGTEVCRYIRSKANTPVIMLTAKDTEVDKVVGLELGADDYVTKPFSTPELLARIRAVLRRGS
jgi:two-component system response regulator RegX3